MILMGSGLDHAVCRCGKGFIHSSNLMYAYCLRQ